MDDRRVLALLEPGQLVLERKPLGRRRLTRGTVFLLTMLRVYVVVAVALVVYAFWHAVHVHG